MLFAQIPNDDRDLWMWGALAVLVLLGAIAHHVLSVLQLKRWARRMDLVLVKYRYTMYSYPFSNFGSVFQVIVRDAKGSSRGGSILCPGFLCVLGGSVHVIWS